MKKISRYVVPLILILLFVSCSKDDSESSQQEQSPGNFFVTTDLGFKSVSVTWSTAQGEANENLSYAIFIDDELIAENLTERSYTVDSLELSTTYNLKVIAKNENGETPVEISFKTLNPDNFSFRLKSCQNAENETEIRYIYNEAGLLAEAEATRGAFTDFVSYDYDEEGNLLVERYTVEEVYFLFGSRVEFTYENNQIIDFGYADSGDTYKSFNFISPDNYIVSDYFMTNLLSTRNVQLERADGKITSCLVTDMDSKEVIYHANFTYSNGNLVQTSNLLNGDVWVFEYDNKSNFDAHKSYLKKTILAMSHIPFSIASKLYFYNGYIPEFVDYFNKNNPTAVHRNGELLHTITYEYTEFDYPSKIYLDNAEEPVLLTYDYIEK
tara:strand:- start:195830 stop:196978 length:1149 start_codon:yes stop_codon:yes gene_type:complete